jgi:small subunit ribosomal protein S21
MTQNGAIIGVVLWTRDGASAICAHLGKSVVGASASPLVSVINADALEATLERGTHVQVLVRDNNVDQALKALKKKMQREGIFREMKLRGHYEKPSEKRAREEAEAVRRARKLARKRAQREGLLPPPKPRVPRT